MPASGEMNIKEDDRVEPPLSRVREERVVLNEVARGSLDSSLLDPVTSPFSTRDHVLAGARAKVMARPRKRGQGAVAICLAPPPAAPPSGGLLEVDHRQRGALSVNTGGTTNILCGLHVVYDLRL